MVSVEDEYNGYRIPKGSLIIGNSWQVLFVILQPEGHDSCIHRAVLHDPKHFPDPMVFKPERFLTEDGQLNPAMQDAEQAVFGFGRRICPGRHMASDTIWLTVASILSTFTLTNPLDEHGSPITPSGEYISGFVMCVRCC